MKYFSPTLKIILGVLVFGGIVLGYKGIFKSSSPSLPQDIKVVEVEEIRPQNIKEVIHLIGTVVPKRSTTLVAKTKGVWQPVVEEGAYVKEGQLIGEIESSSSEKNYLLAQNAEKIALSQYERALALRKEGYLSKQGLEEKKNAWILAQKESSLAKMEVQKVTFYAPFDGVLGVFKMRAGAFVDEKDPLVRFYDPTEIMVEFDIPSSVIRFIKDNQSVEVNGKEYKLAHVQKIADDDTQMFPAYVNVTGEDFILGSSVGVDLTVRSKSGVLVIPFEALFMQKGETSIYRVEENQTVLSKVELGLREKDKIEILSGLKEGDRIILRGHDRLYPNCQVKIYQEPSAPAL